MRPRDESAGWAAARHAAHRAAHRAAHCAAGAMLNGAVTVLLLVFALPERAIAQRSTAPLGCCHGRGDSAGPIAVAAGIPSRHAVSLATPLAARDSIASIGVPASLIAAPTVTHHDWWIPVASAVLPGTGQARLGDDRFVGYMAVEGFLWIRYLTDRRAGIDARNAYRDMALRVSRAGFPGPKPQGNFEYYERMEHWIASGVYDADPNGVFTPEVDTTTFNGKMWSIARTTYWSDPRTPPPVGSAPYEAALRFYRENAVPPEFQWSWRNAPLHQDVYRRDVRASNDGFRRAAQDIGAVIANHVLSTVDAYISLRLQLGESGEADASNLAIGATLPFETIDRIVKHAPGVDRSR